MRNVYKNALCNIAATGSPDSSAGLFRDRDPALIPSIKILALRDGGLDTGLYDCFPDKLWDHDIGRAPLNKRAWVVQERFLPRRNLHFGIQMLYFECHEVNVCEAFPDDLPASFVGRPGCNFKTDSASIYSPVREDRDLFNRRWLNEWRKIGRAYMISDLTYASDKLVALSGVAEEFRLATDARYLAGLWKPYLAEQLLWVVHQCQRVDGRPSARPLEYRAPSWSWLSIDANVLLPELDFENPLIEILDASTILANNKQLTGSILQGYLMIRGKLQAATLQLAPKDNSMHCYMLNREGSHLGFTEVFFDEPTSKPSEVFYVLVLSSALMLSDKRLWRLQGLLLVPTGDRDLEFRRIGTFREADPATRGGMLKTGNNEEIVFTIV